jgi:hypothetical protein
VHSEEPKARSFTTKEHLHPKTVNNSFMGLAYQGKDIYIYIYIVFRFIMEYSSSSLRGFL